jgi:putative hydrolase
MQIIADTHTHTLATDHAYSTLRENAEAAARLGLEAICLTEHSPAMPGGPSWLFFEGYRSIPRTLCGVRIFKGIEANIMDYSGALDMERINPARLELIIASLHTPNIAPATREEHTACWLKIAENPLVDVIGHCGDMRYDFNHDAVLPAFKEHGKIVEINAHSFRARPGSGENCARIAQKCAALGIPVVASSDAHHESMVGGVKEALGMLGDIGFPEELILNAESGRFFAAMERIAKRRAANI